MFVNAQLKELAQHLQTIREDERSHLARELHDELGALLTAAKLDVARLKSRLASTGTADAAERLAHLNETLNGGIALKRRIIEDLRPSSLSNLGLVAALEIQLREFAARSEIKVVDRQIEEINDLETQKQRFIARMQVIEKLQRSRSEVVHLFDEVAKTMPDGTYLTAFKQEAKKLKFEGVAQSSTRVSTFMRNISGSQWMKDPELEVVESKSGNSVGNSFVLDASQIVASGDDDDAGAARPKRAVRAGGAP